MNAPDENGSVPDGWRRLRVGDVLELRNGRSFKTSEWATSGRPIIRIQNLKSKHAPFNYFVGELPERFAARPGDLLFAWSGTPGTSFGAHVWHGPDAWINQHIFRVDFSSDDFDRDFLKFALDANLASYIDQAQGGVGLAHITKSKLNDSELLAPPVVEQRRIAERLGQVDAHRAAAAIHLKTARGVVERFRTAVLAAACAGRLTADWRESNADVPSVEAALSKVVQKTRRKPATPVADLAFPELPASYLVSTIGAASDRLEYGTSRRADSTGDVPVLRMGNIQAGRLDVRELKYLSADAETAALTLEDGDILFNRTNSPELVGKSAVFHETEPMTFASYLIRVRLAREVADPDFANYWLNSSWGHHWAHRVKTDGVSQSNINGTKLAGMPLPLPPLEEQREIVRRADEMLAIADRLSAQIEITAAALDRVSTASLARAFRGQLVPTEAALAEEDGRDFESAEPLLARVNATNNATPRQRRKATS